MAFQGYHHINSKGAAWNNKRKHAKKSKAALAGIFAVADLPQNQQGFSRKILPSPTAKQKLAGY